MADTTTVNKFQTLEDQVKIAELNMEIRKSNEWTWDRQRQQTEAEAKKTDNTGEMTDIFKQQESFNQSIMKVMEGLSGGGDTTPTYVTAQAPVQQEAPKSTNYILWAGIAIVGYLLFMRKR